MNLYVVSLISFFENRIKQFKVEAPNDYEAVKKGLVLMCESDEGRQSELEYQANDGYPQTLEDLDEHCANWEIDFAVTLIGPASFENILNDIAQNNHSVTTVIKAEHFDEKNPPSEELLKRIEDIKNDPTAIHADYSVHFNNKMSEVSLSVDDEMIKAMQGTIDSCVSDYNLKEQLSDGYHTFKELYEFRKLYNAALFNEWANVFPSTCEFQGVKFDYNPAFDAERTGNSTHPYLGKFKVHKSKRHYDGSLCFDGNWFIVVAELPTGQISNHYHMDDWDLFQVPEVESALLPFDGHTSKDVAERITAFLKSTNALGKA
jgi:hypothetical protein